MKFEIRLFMFQDSIIGLIFVEFGRTVEFDIRLFLFRDSTIRLFVHSLSSFSVSHGAGSSESAPVGIHFS